MSDERPGSEQPSEPAQSESLAGDRWGDPIGEARQAELKPLADQQRTWAAAPDHQGRESYFKGVRLTRADVFWLAAYALAGPEGDVAAEQKRLRTARDIGMIPVVSALHLEGANLYGAHLEGAILDEAHLEGVDLGEAHLEGKTYAPGDADLARIQQWVPDYDFPAPLPPADLRLAFFDTATALNRISLGDAKAGTVQVADVRWGGVNLAVVDWTPFTDRKAVLRDEQAARDWKLKPFSKIAWPGWEPAAARAEHAARQAQEHLQLSQAAVRANRQLATVLRDQGMNEEADYFAYRAQVVQRRVFHLQGQRGRRLGSLLLDGVSGYGYKPRRSVITYLLVVTLFALVYWALGVATGHTLTWNETAVVSLTAFHGRGFFATAFLPGDPQAAVAAIEAVIGLLIEITFIATFTQRFFAR